ncbi:Growth regulation protein [Candida viswanathii]|uniref:Growth regulation protein n=1 Tax=Candida viswanathii TaxID=5486 RepID=A0A367YIB6_9ASCO|nr:Growth regulation protein [Candida viswanathii]
MSQQDIVTQVSPQDYNTSVAANQNVNESDADYNSIIHLNIRGKEFTITRDDLMSLPESILLCLFPNGVFLDVNGQVINNLTEDDIVYVNFDPFTFQYIINTFYRAQQDLIAMQQTNNQLQPTSSYNTRHSGGNNRQENILETKPAIIVLREDLDFYVIPPVEGLNAEQMKQLKLGVSAQLLKNKLIFSGLGYKFDDDEGEGVQIHDQPGDTDKASDTDNDSDSTIKKSKGLGPAEQHLFDMLCSSGFEVKDKWGCRSLEPNKCVISSLLLVRLKTTPPAPPETPPDSPSLQPVASNASGNGRSRSRSRIAQLASNATRAALRSLSNKRNGNKGDNTQTKLLLFWRKPARKCWWSHGWVNIEVDAPDLFDLETGHDKMTVKVHIRRVWTLELSVIGVQ